MQLPTAWLDVLRGVQAVFPGAIIAGGALRDLDNNKPVKDVDIFVPVSDYDHNNAVSIENLMKKLQAKPHKLSAPAGGYDVKSIPSDADRDLWAIYTLEHKGYEFDIIFGTYEACDITTFDINICQIMHDGRVSVSTLDYQLGHKKRRIELLNVNRTDRNAKRIERISAKYPDYTVGE